MTSGSGGGGPRAYVTFGGENAVNDTTHDIVSSSYNVASITDGGVGIYYVDFTSPISDPVATYSLGGIYPTTHNIKYFASIPSGSNFQTELGGSIVRISIEVITTSQSPPQDAKFVSLVVH